MYLRFVTPVRSDACRAETGIFQGVYRILDNDEYARDWRFDELCRELDWFDEHLDAPDRTWNRFGRHGLRSGVCWFKDRARASISRARYMAWLLNDLGMPVEEIRTDHPGTLIWEDDQQVVALAGPHVPRAFQ